MAGERISLRHIAEACGVSRNTVSLALRNHTSISEATRLKVHEAADRLGYVPDPEVSKLMVHLGKRKKPSGIVGEIAYVSTIASDDGGPTHLHYFEPAKAFLEANGYRLTPFLLHVEGHSEDELNDILESRGIEGVIVAPLPPDRSEVRLNWERLSGVAIGRRLTEPRLPHIDIDFYHSAYTCVKKLSELGYKRIGAAIPGLYDLSVRYSATSGYAGAMVSLGLGNPIVLDQQALGVPLTARLLKDWLKGNEIDAIVGYDFDLPEIKRLSRDGWHIPEELGFAAVFFTEEGKSEMSGVFPDSTGVGEAAAAQLIGAMRRTAYGAPRHSRVTLVEGLWQDGPTTRKVAES